MKANKSHPCHPLPKHSKIKNVIKTSLVSRLVDIFSNMKKVHYIKKIFTSTSHFSSVFVRGYCLLFGREVMTNLDSIFKSRDITLPTKVHLVKTMIFPVVMYDCESWTVKKAESRRIDAFLNCGVGEDS